MERTLKKFWHTLKPFLLDKSKSKEPIILVNNEDIKSKEKEVVKTLNDIFTNIAKNLEFPEYQCEDNLHIRLSSHSALQAIVKYRDHLRINII